MKNTCLTECPLWKKFKDKCPNFMVSHWKNPEGKERRIEDCAPKRTFLMLQSIENRVLALEQSNQQQRNAMVKAFNSFVRIAEHVNSQDKEAKHLKEGYSGS